MKDELIDNFCKNIENINNLCVEHRPAFPYFGGKQQLIKLLLKYLPDISSYDTYIEPFAGGATLFFAKPLSKINVLNEINGEITNMYLQMQLHKEEFIKCALALSNSQILQRKDEQNNKN
jgi:DNA adenine methylase